MKDENSKDDAEAKKEDETLQKEDVKEVDKELDEQTDGEVQEDETDKSEEDTEAKEAASEEDKVEQKDRDDKLEEDPSDKDEQVSKDEPEDEEKESEEEIKEDEEEKSEGEEAEEKAKEDLEEKDIEEKEPENESEDKDSEDKDKDEVIEENIEEIEEIEEEVELDEAAKPEEKKRSFFGWLFSPFKQIPMPKAGYMMIGFILIALVSAWINLKQARIIDSAADVFLERTKIESLELEQKRLTAKKNHPDTTNNDEAKFEAQIKENAKTLEELQFKAEEEKIDVVRNTANVLNGNWFWMLIVQFGALLFGIGVINIILSKTEDSRVRSAAVLVVGFVVIFMLLSRLIIIYASSEALQQFLIPKD